MLVVVGRTRQIFEQPGLLLAGLNVLLGANACKLAQMLEPRVWTRAAAEEYRSVRLRIIWHDTLEVGMHRPVHRTIEGLIRFDPPIEDPSPA